jgi:hypothetical protein
MIERRCPLIRLQLIEDIDLRAKILPFPSPTAFREGKEKVLGAGFTLQLIVAEAWIHYTQPAAQPTQARL